MTHDTKVVRAEGGNTRKRDFLEVERVQTGSFREQQLCDEFTVHRVYNIYYFVIIDWKYKVKEAIWCTNKTAHAVHEHGSEDISRGGIGHWNIVEVGRKRDHKEWTSG